MPRWPGWCKQAPSGQAKRARRRASATSIRAMRPRIDPRTCGQRRKVGRFQLGDGVLQGAVIRQQAGNRLMVLGVYAGCARVKVIQNLGKAEAARLRFNP